MTNPQRHRHRNVAIASAQRRYTMLGLLSRSFAGPVDVTAGKITTTRSASSASALDLDVWQDEARKAILAAVRRYGDGYEVMSFENTPNGLTALLNKPVTEDLPEDTKIIRELEEAYRRIEVKPNLVACSAADESGSDLIVSVDVPASMPAISRNNLKEITASTMLALGFEVYNTRTFAVDTATGRAPDSLRFGFWVKRTAALQ